MVIVDCGAAVHVGLAGAIIGAIGQAERGEIFEGVRLPDEHASLQQALDADPSREVYLNEFLFLEGTSVRLQGFVIPSVAIESGPFRGAPRGAADFVLTGDPYVVLDELRES